MNPDRSGLDPAYFLAVLLAIVVIGGFALLAGAVFSQRPHHVRRCWWETNAVMPMGRELICGTTQQHDQAKQHSYFIADYPGEP